jgi:hypothetical protein
MSEQLFSVTFIEQAGFIVEVELKSIIKETEDVRLTLNVPVIATEDGSVAPTDTTCKVMQAIWELMGEHFQPIFVQLDKNVYESIYGNHNLYHMLEEANNL